MGSIKDRNAAAGPIVRRHRAGFGKTRRAARGRMVAWVRRGIVLAFSENSHFRAESYYDEDRVWKIARRLIAERQNAE